MSCSNLISFPVYGAINIIHRLHYVEQVKQDALPVTPSLPLIPTRWKRKGRVLLAVGAHNISYRVTRVAKRLVDGLAGRRLTWLDLEPSSSFPLRGKQMREKGLRGFGYGTRKQWGRREGRGRRQNRNDWVAWSHLKLPTSIIPLRPLSAPILRPIPHHAKSETGLLNYFVRCACALRDALHCCTLVHHVV